MTGYFYDGTIGSFPMALWLITLIIAPLSWLRELGGAPKFFKETIESVD
jgi:hypothetical protein